MPSSSYASKSSVRVQVRVRVRVKVRTHHMPREDSHKFVFCLLLVIGDCTLEELLEAHRGHTVNLFENERSEGVSVLEFRVGVRVRVIVSVRR